jgi:pSer/pThr/pTyr-binding forkhead associated (FHA) protein
VSESPYALRFISGKYEGGEFPLPSASNVIIGRGGELDIVLVEDMVSRKHAKISIAEGKIVIEDLGSTNGTFVNGEKIKRARLKEGDRVLIGTSILKLINAQDSKQQENVKETLSPQELNQLLENRQKARGGQRDAATTMSGSLSEMQLPDLLTMLSSMKKAGTLAVTNGEDSGRIYVRDGQVYYAILNNNDDLGPMKALFRMVGWKTGEFRLGPPSTDEFMLELEESTEQLIMEAARQQDEFARVSSSLPEPEDMIAVAKPLTSPLTALETEELEVFQLVHNLGFFQSVLDQSPYTDLKTATIVQDLINKEYCHV